MDFNKKKFKNSSKFFQKNVNKTKKSSSNGNSDKRLNKIGKFKKLNDNNKISELESISKWDLDEEKSIRACSCILNDESINNSENLNRDHIILSPEQLLYMKKDEIIKKWYEQEKYISFMKTILMSSLTKVKQLKESQNENKDKQNDPHKKEQYHIMRLATKEHELQELAGQIEVLKTSAFGENSLKNTLIDPAVNLLFERMKRELDASKSKIEETQNELTAWKFTPDSNTGKQLMAKCRLLIKENEELGKMISSGKLAKLEGELTLQKNLCEELKKSQSELEEFLQEIDEDTEAMQGTIQHLQTQLRQTKEKFRHSATQESDETIDAVDDGRNFSDVSASQQGNFSDVSASQQGNFSDVSASQQGNFSDVSSSPRFTPKTPEKPYVPFSNVTPLLSAARNIPVRLPGPPPDKPDVSMVRGLGVALSFLHGDKRMGPRAPAIVNNSRQMTYNPSIAPPNPNLPPHSVNMPPPNPNVPPHNSNMPPHNPSMPPHNPNMSPHNSNMPPHNSNMLPLNSNMLPHNPNIPPPHNPNMPPPPHNPNMPPRMGNEMFNMGGVDNFKRTRGIEMPVRFPDVKRTRNEISDVNIMSNIQDNRTLNSYENGLLKREL